MLQIKVEDGREDVQDATVAVGWCIDRVTREMLFQRKVENPHVLLIVVPEHGGTATEQRFLAPLDQLMNYVSFRKPLTNLVRIEALTFRIRRPAEHGYEGAADELGVVPEQ